MGRTAIHIQTAVQPGGRIEVVAPPGVREGDAVDVVLLTEDRDEAPRRSFLEILDSLPAGMGAFSSAQEVDTYIRKERDSWER